MLYPKRGVQFVEIVRKASFLPFCSSLPLAAQVLTNRRPMNRPPPPPPATELQWRTARPFSSQYRMERKFVCSKRRRNASSSLNLPEICVPQTPPSFCCRARAPICSRGLFLAGELIACTIAHDIINVASCDSITTCCLCSSGWRACSVPPVCTGWGRRILRRKGGDTKQQPTRQASGLAVAYFSSF